MTEPEKLPVVFRVERGKRADVTAVFPTLPADMHGQYFTVYAHVGQHGGGGFEWYYRTRPAKPEEYADLLAELRGIYGRRHHPDDSVFDLVPYKRMTPQHRAAFNADVARMRRL